MTTTGFPHRFPSLFPSLTSCFCGALAVLGFMAATPAMSAARTVAVLEFGNSNGATISPEDKQQLIETVRGIARRSLPKAEGWDILKPAEVASRMPSGLDLSTCDDEKCVLSAGQKLKVDYIVSENVGRVGPYLQASFSLYDVASGTLIGSEWPRGKTPDDIVDALEGSPDQLFASLSSNPDRSTGSSLQSSASNAQAVSQSNDASDESDQAAPETQVIMYDGDGPYYDGPVVVDPYVYPYYYCCGPGGVYFRGGRGGGGGHFHGGGGHGGGRR